jgi:hypothetical protein
MNSTINFHLNDVKAVDEKILPKAEFKEDLLLETFEKRSLLPNSGVKLKF